MKSVTIYGKSTKELMELLGQMKQHGWVIGVDFDWVYHRSATYDTKDRRAVFKFYKEEYSTYFALRWL
jgi:hypothetical protein